MLTSDSTLYLCIWLLLCVAGLSLWACHLWTCLSAGFCISLHSSPFLFLYCLSPWQSIWGIPSLTSWLSFVLASFSHCCLSCTFPRHRPPCMIFLSLPLAVSYPPPQLPLSQQSCQIKITSLKIQSTLPPTNSVGLLVGYSCIQVYIVSWWRSIGKRGGAQHGNSIKIWCIHS